MVKNKSIIKDMSIIGLDLGVSTIAIGALPETATGVAGVKAGVISGYSKFSTVFPVMGKLGATAVTVKLADKLSKQVGEID